MAVPKLMEEIAECVKVQCDNELDVYAIYNIFLARFASAIATKNILTNSCRHAEAKPLAYYGLNFLPSGGNKDKPFTILSNMFDWLDTIYDKKNQEIREKYISDNSVNLKDKDLIALKEKANNLPKLKNKINGATEQKIYQICSNIAENHFGSVFFYDTEFVNKFEKANSNGNYDKTLSAIYNLYEGNPDFTDTTMTDRKPIKNISCSVCYASDFGKLLRNKKLNQSFKDYLSGGFARRTYIYSSKELDISKREFVYPTLSERNEQKAKIPKFIDDLYKIYLNVQDEKVYKFSFEADTLIDNYNKKMKEMVKEKFAYADILPIEDEIIKVDLMGSTWKIVKTAFLFHFMLDPSSLIVSQEAVQMAIDYYKEFSKFLPELLNKKYLSENDRFKIFVYKNLDKELSLNTDIREALNCDARNWKLFKKEILPDLYNELQENDIYYSERQEGKKQLITFYKMEKNNDRA